MSPLLWITSMYALHVCVLYARLGASGASVLLVCFFYRIWACMGVCVVTLAPVVRLHDSRYSYGVLLCADAWPVWESETVSVRYDCVCLWSNSASTVGVSDAQLASTGDVAQCTQCTFPVVDIWYYLVSVYDFSRVYMFVTCFLHAVYFCFTGKLFCVLGL